MSTRTLTQAQAQDLDHQLMDPNIGGWTIEQLMELAGLSVAAAVHREYPHSHRVLVVCGIHRNCLTVPMRSRANLGPGNNGGDGLVAARHLHMFGHRPSILYPKPSTKGLFTGLVRQNQILGIPFLDALSGDQLRANFDVVVDAIFGVMVSRGAIITPISCNVGFGFRGDVREPFEHVLQMLSELQSPPLVSIDVPSGWHVERGDLKGDGIRPEMLVSLSAPKLCAKHFTGAHHYLGGRFLPTYIGST